MGDFLPTFRDSGIFFCFFLPVGLVGGGVFVCVATRVEVSAFFSCVRARKNPAFGVCVVLARRVCWAFGGLCAPTTALVVTHDVVLSCACVLFGGNAARSSWAVFGVWRQWSLITGFYAPALRPGERGKHTHRHKTPPWSTAM